MKILALFFWLFIYFFIGLAILWACIIIGIFDDIRDDDKVKVGMTILVMYPILILIRIPRFIKYIFKGLKILIKL